MQASDITPFVKATKNVFDTMLRVPVSFGKPILDPQPDAEAHHVSGIIGLSGDLVGAVVVAFPKETAELCVKALVGEMTEIDSEIFSDAIGELANMISGAAKAQYTGKSISISCPSVVIGGGHKIYPQSNSRSVCIPCRANDLEFSIIVTIRDTEAGQNAVAA